MPSSVTTTTTVEPKTKNAEPDFFWTYTEEPHRTRRMAIIKAHPEASPPPRSPRH